MPKSVILLGSLLCFLVAMLLAESLTKKPDAWAEHCVKCSQCRGEGSSEEGGPPPLCAEGFELFKKSLR